jgi:hypothetical protein
MFQWIKIKLILNAFENLHHFSVALLLVVPSSVSWLKNNGFFPFCNDGFLRLHCFVPSLHPNPIVILTFMMMLFVRAKQNCFESWAKSIYQCFKLLFSVIGKKPHNSTKVSQHFNPPSLSKLCVRFGHKKACAIELFFYRKIEFFCNTV